MNNSITRTWKPVVAGILNILVGCIILCMLFLFGIAAMIVKPVGGEITNVNVSGLLLILPGILISLLDIIGGLFALRRKRWVWALTGSVCAVIGPTPLGIIAIVLIILSRNEFS